MPAVSTEMESNPADEADGNIASKNTASNLSDPGIAILRDWGEAIDRLLDRQISAAVAPLAQVILARYPRHLATYERLLRALWLGKHWQEGNEWGRRLLQADPNNPLAWRAVARAAAERRERVQANLIWQRAFEVSPYAADIRAGLVRTSINVDEPLALTPACLGTLYIHGNRWQHAVAIYRSLIEADSRRIDFQVNLMVALWRMGSEREAYRLARHLARNHPLLIMPWVVVTLLGDETDRALAQNPLATMDPDGEFVRHWLRLDKASPGEKILLQELPGTPTPLDVNTDEAKLLVVGQSS